MFKSISPALKLKAWDWESVRGNLAVGDKANSASRWGWNAADKADVKSESAGERYVPHSSHLGESINDALILSLLERLNKHLPVCGSGVLVYSQPKGYEPVSDLRARTRSNRFKWMT